MSYPADSYDTDEGEFAEAETPWMKLQAFIWELGAHWLLLFPIVILFLALTAYSYATSHPIYVAVATIGPPNPSPTSSLRASVNGAGIGVGGAASRFLGGANSSFNDPFLEYQQVLHSSRLASELDTKDHLLQLLYAGSWDAKRQVWRQRGGFSRISDRFNRFFHRPVRRQPDASTLAQFLNANVDVTPIGVTRNVLVSSTSPYQTVSLSYGSPEMAKKLLALILARADTLIREQQLKDVMARITFIGSELQKVTENDYRQTLIDTLSGQEQLRIMMVADERYSFTMVDTPHANYEPKSPAKPSGALAASVVMGVMTWIALVFLGTKVAVVGRLTGWFRRRRKDY